MVLVRPWGWGDLNGGTRGWGAGRSSWGWGWGDTGRASHQLWAAALGPVVQGQGSFRSQPQDRSHRAGNLRCWPSLHNS